jgi:hypothetical protein
VVDAIHRSEDLGFQREISLPHTHNLCNQTFIIICNQQRKAPSQSTSTSQFKQTINQRSQSSKYPTNNRDHRLQSSRSFFFSFYVSYTQAWTAIKRCYYFQLIRKPPQFHKQPIIYCVLLSNTITILEAESPQRTNSGHIQFGRQTRGPGQASYERSFIELNSKVL